MRRSYSSSSFLSDNNLSAANQQRGGKKTLPAVAAYQFSDKPIQRAVSHSASYLPPLNAHADIAALEGQVAAAELAATNAINNQHVVHSNRQAAYMTNPTKRGWGCCVEEQLNLVAVGMGWATQHRLASSRPDYHKKIQNNEVFVDLTSEAEAGAHGHHITGKLDVSAPGGQRPANWKGSDITHASSDPLGGGPPVMPVPNGLVTPEHARYFHDYRAFVDNRNGGDWSQGMQNLLNIYKGPISKTTFSQVWDQIDRNLFVTRAKQQLDEESEDFTEVSDNDEPMTDVPESDGSNDSDGDYVPEDNSN